MYDKLTPEWASTLLGAFFFSLRYYIYYIWDTGLTGISYVAAQDAFTPAPCLPRCCASRASLRCVP